MTIGMIWAQTADGIIGANGTIPWRHTGDLKRFKRVTMGATVVMGRKTWESIGKPLPGRNNIVIASSMPETFRHSKHVDGRWKVLAHDVENALRMHAVMNEQSRNLGPELGGATADDVWIIGGAQVYAAAMPYAEVLDVTYVPNRIQVIADDCFTVPDPSRECFQESLVVRAPTIDETIWEAGELVPHEDAPGLTRRTYTRRATP